jgi:hypothetical protein
MTWKTLADVRVLVRHLPEDRRTQPAWPASPHSLSKQPRGVYGGKRRFGSIATQLLHCSEPLISLHRKLPAT